MYPRTMVSSERLKEVMDMPISINLMKMVFTETESHGYLEFDNVTFNLSRWDGRWFYYLIFLSKQNWWNYRLYWFYRIRVMSSLVQLIPRFMMLL